MRKACSICSSSHHFLVSEFSLEDIAFLRAESAEETSPGQSGASPWESQTKRVRPAMGAGK